MAVVDCWANRPNTRFSACANTLMQMSCKNRSRQLDIANKSQEGCGKHLWGQWRCLMRSSRQKAFKDAIFVRLFRLWAMGREDHEPALPRMHEEASKHGYKDQAAAACSSLFELVESHLGRQLRRECCCSPCFSPDERALIGVLRAAPGLSMGKGSREVPHGLPGAISWAASCVCDAMEIAVDRQLQTLRNSAANQQECPFQWPIADGEARGV